ncbi:YfhO family protein [Flavobacterium kingsejongi]|uniref:Membrane protein YfhO n=1 Tax=Flavobacterium kingsejongi TaxID=1678728 RepID=A0A2S1LQ56_9FLAO|nr:YfhO family protein [Flavobacterium kingsejongi]AWG25885.1 hypothetical protein FK004_11965 [Flavobacterium kingsejongi]
MKVLNKFYPHLLSVAGFLLIALIYFYPVLQGKEMLQSDIQQYTGMAKEQNDFRKEEKTEPYWTNSAFGGMPTYQLGAKYPHNYIKSIDGIIRFLPRPADYLFIYFLGFYGLLLVLKADPLKAFIGALAFGFSTYLIVILGVGHNAKAHAIAYIPLVVAGVIMVFQRRYIAGGILTMLATALEINANHFQMTLYLLILLLVIGIYFMVQIIKNKEYKVLLPIAGTFLIALILAIGANATSLMATKEYADFSIRSDSDLTYSPDGSKATSTNAMTYDYITEYSYGIAESLNLIAPRLFGGATHEKLGKDSHMVEFLQTQPISEDHYISEAQAVDYASQGMPTYWGDQPIVAAPAYIGAVVFFLFVLAMFVEKRKLKYAFLIGAILTLMLSWGKNFPVLTNLFLDFFPMYDKFRAVSSIQVIVELCMPVLAIMGLYSFFKSTKEEQWDGLKKSGMVSLGLIVLLFIAKSLFSFSGGNDAYYIQNTGPDFVNALKEDRRSMYTSDLLRSGFLILASAGILWCFIKEKVSHTTAVVLVGILMVGDLVLIDKNYVDNSSFVSPGQAEQPFEASQADLWIKKDTTDYRVFEVSGLLNGRTSYFHKSIGGYSAVRPKRMQQLFDYQLANNNIEVLNMLNVKYIIQKNEKGQDIPVPNPDANGNAWFVKSIETVQSADAEMKALDSLDSKITAIVNEKEFGSLIKAKSFTVDSSATIKMVQYKPNYLKYSSNNTNDGLAVFSEMYYKKGWNVTIDGKAAEHFRADYILRALNIPAGKHTIEFKFEPQVVKTGSMITLFSFIGMLIAIGGGIYYSVRKDKNKKSVNE